MLDTITAFVARSERPALLSIEDASIAPLKWEIGTDGYARRKALVAEVRAGAPVRIAMHRQVMGLHITKGRPGDLEVDHINGDRLDNRRCNLRLCTRQSNNLNRHAQVGRSKYTGVSFFKPAKLWRAYLTWNGHRKDIGYFKTEEEAARARVAYEAELLAREGAQ